MIVVVDPAEVLETIEKMNMNNIEQFPDNYSKKIISLKPKDIKGLKDFWRYTPRLKHGNIRNTW